MNIHKKYILGLIDSLSTIPASFEGFFTYLKANFTTNIFCEHFSNGSWSNISYSQLFTAVDNVSKNIVSCKNKNKYVALSMHNSPYWLAIFWGIMQAGYTPVLLKPENNINFNYLKKKLKWGLEINDQNYSKFLKPNKKQISPKWSNEVIFISSGTTGLPKIITHHGDFILNQIKHSSEVLQVSKEVSLNFDIDRVRLIVVLPFYHIFSFLTLGVWFIAFGRCLVFPKDLSPQAIQQACLERNVTHFFATPMVWDKLVDAIIENAKSQNKYDKFIKAIKSSLRLQSFNYAMGLSFAKRAFKEVRQKTLGPNLSFLISGGAHISEQTLRIMQGLGYPIHNGYGLTECGILSINLSKKVNCLCSQSVGLPFHNIDWRIGDKNCLEIKLSDQKEWVITNDVASHNKKHNYLSINGRTDNLIIKSDGENICLEQIENIFTGSSLYNVAVIGVMQRSGYHKLLMFVNPTRNLIQAKMAEIYQQITNKINLLSIHERPSKIYLCDKLPLNELRKVNHLQLLHLYEAKKIKMQEWNNQSNKNIRLYQNLDKETLTKVKKCFAEVFKMKLSDIKDDTHFINDLGGSSIDYYELLNKIAKITKKEIQLSTQTPLLTPADFCIYLC